MRNSRSSLRKKAKRDYARPSERGLGPKGGGWNIDQASEWSGMGSKWLRDKAKSGEIPVYKIGRRFLIPRQGFIDWFNKQGSAA